MLNLKHNLIKNKAEIQQATNHEITKEIAEETMLEIIDEITVETTPETSQKLFKEKKGKEKYKVKNNLLPKKIIGNKEEDDF